jgi:hypothetical protein
MEIYLLPNILKICGCRREFVGCNSFGVDEGVDRGGDFCEDGVSGASKLLVLDEDF